MKSVEEMICPLCGKPNRCGKKAVIDGITQSRCWCAYETFPKELLAMVPPKKQGKACVCQKCLNQFKHNQSEFMKRD
ncbi:MAG: hypothetical protein OMM_07412 [Candidatus Magnetoglobus multicellularis str. Araruama]|uniref:Cysteine-rich CWC n=1 Tax=Candidatus Magnetoglobus multicellularis str. Araruama TaxID=890399 RepID=A0A1V1PCH3_9BACT|nr:MAG: hypothetical protein OMM_07412 [Candidatus Magnetoglobus multicellularis str. Araruama]